MKEKLLKLNLQFFAEEGEKKEEQQEEKEEITLTEKELQARIDSEKDKHAAKVWETKSAKLREEILAELEAKKEEEIELAKLSEAERKEREFEKREQEIMEREAQLKRDLQLTQVKADLAEKDLPTEFSEMVIVEGDNEKTLEHINSLRSYVDKQIKDAIEGMTRQSTPQSGGGGGKQPKTLGVYARDKNIFTKKAEGQFFRK